MINHELLIGIPVLGSFATAFYEQTLVSLFRQSHGEESVCPYVTCEADFDRINEFLPDKFSGLTPLVGHVIKEVEQAGADFILIPNITLHCAIDRMDLAPRSRQRIIHPMEVGIETLKTRGLDRITLTGTRHTMQGKLIGEYFETEHIRVEYPAEKDIGRLDRIRLKVGESGYSEDARRAMDEVLSGYANIVIACTELSILNTAGGHFDLARLQIAKAVQAL